MRRRLARIVALVVLFIAGSDYCAFDLSDPSAPMDAQRSDAVSQFDAGAAHAPELPDDGCLFCSSITIATLVPFSPVEPVTGVTAEGPSMTPEAQPAQIKHPPKA